MTGTVIASLTSASAGGTAAVGGASGFGAQDSSTNQLTIRITSGPTKGARIQQTVGIDNATPRYEAGDMVTLTYEATAPDGSQYQLKEVPDPGAVPMGALAVAWLRQPPASPDPPALSHHRGDAFVRPQHRAFPPGRNK